MSYQRVKYKLTNNDISESASNPLWLTTDPKNWESSENTLKALVWTMPILINYIGVEEIYG